MIALAVLLLLSQPPEPAREADLCVRDADCGAALVCWPVGNEKRCVPGCPALPRGCPPGSICSTVSPDWPAHLPREACMTERGTVLP